MPLLVKADEITPLSIVFDNPLFPGDVIEMDFQLTDSGGVAQDLTSTRWLFGLGKASTSGAANALITKDSNVAGQFVIDIPNKKAQLRVAVADTLALVPDQYAFTVRVTLADGRRLPFASGAVRFAPTYVA